ncbi:hypothetical protein GCM10020358_13320 [Amorphoplanes nipponensis]|uniref:Lipoprotein n=1 Tax=Actinoplanes nipponensis TaxID=135950 RepID=A0A919JJE7_9ACTN|nr:hypothetical protein [Actinoplanes nipponensis]GIE50552.1 hypothetical protein Ani05nite_40860 [Actinoplanes nipponensis]
MNSYLSRRAAISVAVAGVLCLSVAACGDSDTESPSAAGPTTVATANAAAGGDSRTVSAADLCAFLDSNLPRWKSAGGQLAAMTEVTTEMFTFYDEKGQVVPRTELDEMTKAECPAARTEVLKTIGFTSFLEL